MFLCSRTNWPRYLSPSPLPSQRYPLEKRSQTLFNKELYQIRGYGVSRVSDFSIFRSPSWITLCGELCSLINHRVFERLEHFFVYELMQTLLQRRFDALRRIADLRLLDLRSKRVYNHRRLKIIILALLTVTVANYLFFVTPPLSRKCLEENPRMCNKSNLISYPSLLV